MTEIALTLPAWNLYSSGENRQVVMVRNKVFTQRAHIIVIVCFSVVWSAQHSLRTFTK